jgi:hypothetical protein
MSSVVITTITILAILKRDILMNKTEFFLKVFDAATPLEVLDMLELIADKNIEDLIGLQIMITGILNRRVIGAKNVA